MQACRVVVATLSRVGFQNESLIVTCEKFTGSNCRVGACPLAEVTTAKRDKSAMVLRFMKMELRDPI
jgi:hypothetical protein